MLTQEEKQFLAYWEANRLPFKTVGSKLVRGLPMAMLFSLPILLLIAVVYFFIPDWYAKVSSAAASSMGATIVAVIIIIIFIAYFRMHFLWEMNEQAYRELLNKKNRNEANQTIS
ncbi:MAG: hypothetical protein IPL97_08055 [Niastella sp.]|nr:hypothetical protein [Niastella sp.]